MWYFGWFCLFSVLLGFSWILIILEFLTICEFWWILVAFYQFLKFWVLRFSAFLGFSVCFDFGWLRVFGIGIRRENLGFLCFCFVCVVLCGTGILGFGILIIWFTVSLSVYWMVFCCVGCLYCLEAFTFLVVCFAFVVVVFCAFLLVV